MKHFSGVLASSHLLDRLLRCIDAFPTAMQPSVRQRVHIGEQCGLCREPLVPLRAKISATGMLNGNSAVGFACFASGIGTS